ncbi:MAG: hypothetical protein P1U89_15270 [Verrucomicrobiales bacterium]|nr:hypothetical protein [Verrucomicrobiales bacterium]
MFTHSGQPPGKSFINLSIERVWHLSRTEKFALAVAMLATLVFHLPFLCSGFGEPDAARLVNDAILWERIGNIDLSTVAYRYRTSPLYLLTIKTSLTSGLEPVKLPYLMSWGNLIIGCLGLIPFYLLARLLSSTVSAAFALAFVLVAPGFWLALNYGFPLLPGLIFLLAAILLTVSTVISTGRTRVFFAVSAVLFYFFSFGCKADLALYVLALPALIWAIAGKKLSAQVLGGALPGLAVGGVLALSKILVKGSDSTTQFIQNWEQQFPTRAGAFVSTANIDIISSTAGPVFFALLIPAVICLLFFGGRNGRILLLIASCWFLPTTLFWGLRDMNSVRHNLGAWLIALIVISAALQMLRAPQRVKITAALMIIVLNYALGFTPVNTTANSPLSSRLIAQSMVWKRQSIRHHAAGDYFTKLPLDEANGKISIAAGLNSYVLFEYLAANPDAIITEAGQLIVEQKSASTETGKVRFAYTMNQDSARSIATKWRDLGWKAWSGTFNLGQ